jgi:glutathione synthase/RimK-type ligase-like ATP-grasp enzyme
MMPSSDPAAVKRIVLATCPPMPEATPGDALLAAELRRRGATVAVKPWNAVDIGADAPAAVCLRSTWDYHHRWPEFQQWVAGFSRRPGLLWNPPETVLWNGDKLYLAELSERGIALPRTRWFDPGSPADYQGTMREWGLPVAVLKPRVSATAHGTHRVFQGRPLASEDWEALESFGSLLQAFVPEVETEGEMSLVFIDGGFSHAVRKRPAPGDFRVQSDFGGSWVPTIPSDALRGFADSVLAAVSRPWLYARVDAVETRAGPLLMELELIEPDLFLTYAPDATARLAAALITRAAA